MDVTVVAAGATAQQQAPEPQAPAAQAQSGISAPPLPAAPPARGALSPELAKIFGGAVPSQIAVNVSYRVERNPDMIVTVFTDPQTGKEIAQVPAEVMVQIAQFFDKESGVTLDRSA